MSDKVRGEGASDVVEPSAPAPNVRVGTATVTDTANPPNPAEGRTMTADMPGLANPFSEGPSQPADGLAPKDTKPLVEVPIDHYEFLGEQGRGGIGVVRRARDRRLDREVAIKELQRDSHAARARFEREMRITAKLQHPGIVPVHECGKWPDGSPFYSMKLVEGRSLKELILSCKNLEDRLTLLPHVIAVADTIAYAHDNGIIHRDLKPSNIIIGAYGETVVIDWGLAKDLREPGAGDESVSPYRVLGRADATAPGTVLGTPAYVAPEQVRSSSDFAPTADVHALSATSFHVIGGAASEYDALPGSPARRTEGTDLTRTGQVLGTPAYMAPEQASGQTADARTDVYALGAILYHVVTGSPPYSGHSSVGIIEKILSSAPAPVQSLQDGVPIDLVSVIQKALHRDPKRRYSNALALAEELRRVQAGQLVRARDYSAMELAVRWFTRHRGYVVGGAIAFVLLLAIAAISFNRVVHARDIALREKLRADERSAAFQVARSEATRRADELVLTQARTLLRHDPARAAATLSDYPVGGARWSEAQSIAMAALRSGLPRHVVHLPDPLGVASSPSGTSIAAAGHKDVIILDAVSGVPRHRLVPSAPLIGSPQWRDEKSVFVENGRGEIEAFQLTHPITHEVYKPECGELVTIVTSPSRRFVAATCGDGRVWLQGPDLLGGRSRLLNQGRIAALDVADNGALTIVGSGGELRTLRGLDPSGSHTVHIPLAGASATLLRRSPTDDALAIGTTSGLVIVMRPRSGKVAYAVHATGGRVDSIQWLGSHLAALGTDHILVILDRSGKTIASFPGVVVMAGSSDGDQVFMGTERGTIIMYDVKTRWHIEVPGHSQRIIGIAVLPHTSTDAIATAGEDGTIRTWPTVLFPIRTLRFDGIGASTDCARSEERLLLSTENENTSVLSAGALTTVGPAHVGRIISRFTDDQKLVLSYRSHGSSLDILDLNLRPRARLEVNGSIEIARQRGHLLAVATSRGDVVFASTENEDSHTVSIADCFQPTALELVSQTQAFVSCRDGRSFMAASDGSPPRALAQWNRPGCHVTASALLNSGNLVALYSDGVVMRDGKPLAMKCSAGTDLLFRSRDGESFGLLCGDIAYVADSRHNWATPHLGTDVHSISYDSEVKTATIGGGDAAFVWWPERGAVSAVPLRSPTYATCQYAPDAYVGASGPGIVHILGIDESMQMPTGDTELSLWLRATRDRWQLLEVQNASE